MSAAEKRRSTIQDLREDHEMLRRATLRLVAAYAIAPQDGDELRIRFQDAAIALGCSNFQEVVRLVRANGEPVSRHGSSDVNTISNKGPYFGR